MRKLRSLVVGALCLAAVPTTGSAQANRLFSDAWFWGAKAGTMTFWTTRVAHQTAPVFGAEWLLTRSKGALYASFDQANFTARSTFRNYDVSSTGRTFYAGEGEAEVHDMRRLTIAAMAFPKRYGNIRPYVGAGFALNFLQGTKQTAGAVTSLSDASIEDVSSTGAPIGIAGVQYQLSRLSIFGQGSYMPARGHFLLNNNETYFLEAGIRYNIGSSIEKLGH